MKFSESMHDPRRLPTRRQRRPASAYGVMGAHLFSRLRTPITLHSTYSFFGDDHPLRRLAIGSVASRCLATVGLTCIVGVVAVGCSHSDGHATAKKSGSTTATRATSKGATKSAQPARVPRAELERITGALGADTDAGLEQILAPEVMTAIGPDNLPASVLPAGSTVTLDPRSARRDGELLSMNATVTGPRPGRFALLFELGTDGHWYLLTSEQRP